MDVCVPVCVCGQGRRVEWFVVWVGFCGPSDCVRCRGDLAVRLCCGLLACCAAGGRLLWDALACVAVLLVRVGTTLGGWDVEGFCMPMCGQLT